MKTNVEQVTLGFRRFQPRTTAVLWFLGFALSLPFTALPQSLWQAGSARSMYGDKRAIGLDDLITILVQESTTASKDNSTATSKKTSLDAAIASMLYNPAVSGLLTKGGQLPAIKLASDHKFAGGGTIDNSEQIMARITVKVIDVQPNGNMVVEGTRETAFGGEKQNVLVHGIVRPQDISANNTVYSYNVADAKIQILTKGSISDSQRRGWFTTLWSKLSPF